MASSFDRNTQIFYTELTSGPIQKTLASEEKRVSALDNLARPKNVHFFLSALPAVCKIA